MPTITPPNHLDELAGVAAQIRQGSLESTTAAGSGHPTSSLSCADLLAGIFFHGLRFDIEHPEAVANDRFVLSKGHAAPALWATLAVCGAIDGEELPHLRRIDSDLEGHPTPRNRFIDVPTGSLGQGLSIGLGMALWSRGLGIDNRVWVLLGDGECAEGSVWEAAMLAAHYGVTRLTAVIDVNRLGQTGETMLGHDCEIYAERFRAFGWSTWVIDGHDIAAIVAAIDASQHQDRPCAIIAQTLKGKGVSFLEDRQGLHGKAVSGADYEQARAELSVPVPAHPRELHRPPAVVGPALRRGIGALPASDFSGDTATRQAYGAALAEAMAHDDRLLALDAEVSNSTGSAQARQRHPERYLECFIAEQNMVGMALGCAALGSIPCLSTFAAFLTRAADQLRMAGISGHHLIVAGSHAGISIGEDGPSQMGLEDVALMRAVVGSTVLCPADAVSCWHVLKPAIDAEGLVYLRLLRPERPLLYDQADDDFPIGGARLLRVSDEDRVCLVASGICVHEALAAADHLAEAGLAVRVIDAYSIKPLAVDMLVASAAAIGHVITIEDHYPAGGLGEAVAASVMPQVPGGSFASLAVHGRPRSGSAEALMSQFGIDADAIVGAVQRQLSADV